MFEGGTEPARTGYPAYGYGQSDVARADVSAAANQLSGAYAGHGVIGLASFSGRDGWHCYGPGALRRGSRFPRRRFMLAIPPTTRTTARRLKIKM